MTLQHSIRKQHGHSEHTSTGHRITQHQQSTPFLALKLSTGFELSAKIVFFTVNIVVKVNKDPLFVTLSNLI